MSIKQSELILNPDGSIYHLHLRPEDLATTIITVGDPDRVDQVSKYFDHIELKQQKREFKTHTGLYKNQRITVMSTGIGSDNIDIVLNELDALVNIDFETRTLKNKLTALNIVRIGTSGALQADIPVDSILMSTYGLDINGMLPSYEIETIRNKAFEKAFCMHTEWNNDRAQPVLVENSKTLEHQLYESHILTGVTATCGGFYGPQGRILRLKPKDSIFRNKLESFRYEDLKITNFEMETSALYGLGKLMGHNCLTICTILANRATGGKSTDYKSAIDNMIDTVLAKLY